MDETLVMRLSNIALWCCAGMGAWLVLLNRWILGWHDGWPKNAAIVGTWIVALAASSYVGYLGLWSWIPLAVIGLLLLGEARRDLLRQSYRFHATSECHSLWRANTTTAIRVQPYQVAVPNLRRPLRVAQVTDLHIDPAFPFDYYAGVLELVKQQSPDLLLLTGDFVSRREGLTLLEQWCRLLSDVPFAAYFVLGNHDHWVDPLAVRQLLSSAGAVDVSGICLRPLSESRDLVICGTEAPWGESCPALPSDAIVRLVLSHTPDNVYAIADAGPTLVFSGHLHGGQVRLPGIGPLGVSTGFRIPSPIAQADATPTRGREQRWDGANVGRRTKGCVRAA